MVWLMSPINANINSHFKRVFAGSGEPAQWLRAIDAFVEDPGLVHINTYRQNIHVKENK